MTVSGGAVVPIEVVKRVKQEFGCQFSIVFGQTETSPVVTATRLDDSPEDVSESLGRAVAQAEVKIVDPETGGIVPVGQPGEFNRVLAVRQERQGHGPRQVDGAPALCCMGAEVVDDEGDDRRTRSRHIMRLTGIRRRQCRRQAE